jgi:hypothetical protein
MNRLNLRHCWCAIVGAPNWSSLVGLSRDRLARKQLLILLARRAGR